MTFPPETGQPLRGLVACRFADPRRQPWSRIADPMYQEVVPGGAVAVLLEEGITAQFVEFSDGRQHHVSAKIK